MKTATLLSRPLVHLLACLALCLAAASPAAADTVATFAGRKVTFSDVSLNGTGTNVVTVAPGSLVNLSLTWSSEYVSNYCPGCIQQFYIGVKDQAIDCMYSGNTAYNRSGPGNLSFTAPSEPGLYPVQATHSLQYSCTVTADQMSDSVTNAVAYIFVDDSEPVFERGMNGRTVTFSDISINGTGTPDIRVAPGAEVSVTLDWGSKYTSNYCPGCIQQFYVGVKDQAIDCMYSGNTSANRSGTGDFAFAAPEAPGIYVIQAGSSLQYSCTWDESSIPSNGLNALGTIEVVAP